jgi:hypothetical protein
MAVVQPIALPTELSRLPTTTIYVHRSLWYITMQGKTHTDWNFNKKGRVISIMSTALAVDETWQAGLSQSQNWGSYPNPKGM